MAARQQWPERSWEMRWYRQHARQLIGDELPHLVSFADEEVVDVAHRRDARVRDRRAELLRGAELIVLRRHDDVPSGIAGSARGAKVTSFVPTPTSATASACPPRARNARAWKAPKLYPTRPSGSPGATVRA